jgi:alkyl hydroperoxide reductase subunit AhpC
MIEVEMVNNFPIGRSSDEILRLLDAAQESKKGMVCPMNFKKGKEAINPKEAKSWFMRNIK